VRGDEPRLCRDGPDSRSSGRNALNVSMIKQNAVHTKVTPLAAIFEVNGVRLGPLGEALITKYYLKLLYYIRIRNQPSILK